MTEKQFDAIGYFKQLTEENNTCRLHNLSRDMQRT